MKLVVGRYVLGFLNSVSVMANRFAVQVQMITDYGTLSCIVLSANHIFYLFAMCMRDVTVLYVTLQNKFMWNIWRERSLAVLCINMPKKEYVCMLSCACFISGDYSSFTYNLGGKVIGHNKTRLWGTWTSFGNDECVWIVYICKTELCTNVYHHLTILYHIYGVKYWQMTSESERQ